MERTKTKDDFWEDYGWRIVDKVGRALDYWCHNVIGEPLYDCYANHVVLDLYDLAEKFVGWSISGITMGDLKLLRMMPKRYYDKFNRYIKREIGRVVSNLILEKYA